MSPKPGLPLQCMLKTTTTVLTDDRSIVLAIAGTLILSLILKECQQKSYYHRKKKCLSGAMMRSFGIWWTLICGYTSKRVSACEEQAVQTLAIGGGLFLNLADRVP